MGKATASGDTITFSSGRIAYANLGIVGLSPDLDQISEGYDSTIPWDFDPTYSELSRDDIAELAEMMIERWTAFRDKLRLIVDKPDQPG